MTRDDIIRMAREAGLRVGTNISGIDLVGVRTSGIGLAHLTVDDLMRFAALVAAAARNRTWTQAHWTEYERSIVAAEREACAKVCEETTAQP